MTVDHLLSPGRLHAHPPSAPKMVTFYVLPDFTMLALSSGVEALRLANRVLGYKAYDWRIVSQDGGTVRSNCGFLLSTDTGLPAERKLLLGVDRPAVVVICGEHGTEEYSTKCVEAWLRECRRQHVVVGAFGAGTYVLASAGLLDDKRCSVHWERLPGFSERFNGTFPTTGLYEVDGDVWTCAGGSASFDMMLCLLEKHFGESITAGICEQALVDRVRAPSDRQRLPLSYRLGVANEAIIKAISQMELNLVEPLSMDELAVSLNLSRRQIERLFRTEIGRSPAQYYRELRLERAGLLLEQTAMPIVDIAIACGFVSASHFSRCFREANGVTPQDIRRKKLKSSSPSAVATPVSAKAVPRAVLAEAA